METGMSEYIATGRVISVAVAEKQYFWKPQPDITTYELAVALGVMFACINNDRGYLVDELEPNVRRHFEARS
jgi:hypothetical protein